MAETYLPKIRKIQLPSGNEYWLEDGWLRDVKIPELEEMISGGVTFKVVWSATDYASTTAPSTAVRATIPDGVTVHYNNGASSTTGTLAASANTKAIFYLIYSKSQQGSADYYDEYVTITGGTSASPTYSWEKIGDTQLNLDDTAEVIGQNATLTLNRPTASISPTTVLTGATTKHMSATASGGNVTLTTQKLKGTASGGNVAWDDKDLKTVLTGVQVTAQPTVSLTANTATATGRIKYVEAITPTGASGTSSTLTATATGGAVSANADDTVTALTGLGAPSTGTAVSGVSTSKLVTTSVTGVSGSTSVTGVSGSVSVTGVQSTTTTASKATAAASQTTATGGYTASATNTDWLMGATVQNEVLSFGAATLNTQTTTQFTFADVTVPIKATSATTVPKAAGSATTVPIAATATTVATGALSTSGTGATVATGSSGTITAVTGYPNVTTDDVLGADTTFDVTQPTITPSLSSVITAVSGGTTTATTKYLSASASGTAVGANGTASVIGSDSTFTVTQPTITLSTFTGAGAGPSVATAIDTVTQPTITLSAGDTSSTGSQKFIQSVSSATPSVTLSGGSVTWADKDLRTAYVEADDADA